MNNYVKPVVGEERAVELNAHFMTLFQSQPATSTSSNKIPICAVSMDCDFDFASALSIPNFLFALVSFCLVVYFEFIVIISKTRIES